MVSSQLSSWQLMVNRSHTRAPGLWPGSFGLATGVTNGQVGLRNDAKEGENEKQQGALTLK